MENYSHQIFTDVSKVNKSDWDNVIEKTDDYAFMSYSFLQILEKTFHETEKMFYVIVYNGNEPIACSVFTLFSVDIAIISGSGVKKLIDAIRKLIPSFLKFKTLFNGVPVSVGQKPIVFKDETQKLSVIMYLDNLLESISKKEKSWLNIYKEVNNEDLYDYDNLSKSGYIQIESLPMYNIDNHFSSFNDYKKALRRRYRSNIDRAEKKFSNGGLRVIKTNNAKEIQRLYTDEVHELYLAVNGKSSNRLEVLPKSFFLELTRQLGEGAHFIFAFNREDKVVGFAACLHNNKDYYCLFCGMDYSINNEFNIYYNIIYNCLKQAIELKAENIQIGQTADEFKSRLGCYAQPLFVYLKFNNRAGNYLIKKLAKYLFEKPVSLHYNVFKKQP